MSDVRVDDLAAGLVAAVVRPDDVEDVRATIARVGPTDLASLVAAVDDHQPMTLEVVVDVLDELGCPPAVIADAVATDLADVQELLGVDPAPPPSALADGPRVIDLGGAGGVVTVGADGGEHVARAPRSDEPPGNPRDGDDPVPDADGSDGAPSDPVRGRAAEPRDDARRIVVIGAGDGPVDVSGEGGRDGAGDATGQGDGDGPGDETGEEGQAHADVSTSTGPTPATESADDAAAADAGVAVDESARSERTRVVWAVALFVLLVGGAIALAVLLGAS